ncbi:MAG: hypothetical protein C4582_12785 [Desulfobacteraceae bacterium]|jgi:muconate cycloisomerase|nr:MAG: hypothetical protein C4582_12785 [Desulfobacteraceae bacterium]
MRIQEILIYPVELAFGADFSHSKRKGRLAQNLVIELTATHGEVNGFGEGAPRQYVTGETQGTAVAAAQELILRKDFPWDLDEPSQLWSFIDGLPGGKSFNSALCALETAALDALGKERLTGIKNLLPQDFAANKITYGATLPLSNQDRLRELCVLAKRLKITSIRIKAGDDLEKNRQSMALVRECSGDGCDIRIDANGCWDKNLALAHIPLVDCFDITVVEQPMAPGDDSLQEFSSALKGTRARLMADESVCTLEEARKTVREGVYSIVNVRLSKCGGFRRSLSIIDYLRGMEIPFQIGCQLGESGLLSAAGRALGLVCRDALYYDGSYDAFLLSENLTTENVAFGAGGAGKELPGNGLGVEVDRDRLLNMSRSKKLIIKRP